MTQVTRPEPLFSTVAEGGSGPTFYVTRLRKAAPTTMMLYESHHSLLFLQTQLTPKSSIVTVGAEMLLLLGDVGVDIHSFKLKYICNQTPLISL